MTKEILYAVVAASGALLVSIVTMIATLLSSRQAGKSARALEELRHALQHADQRDSIREKELVASLDALKLAMKAIQSFKDELQLVLNAVESSLSANEAMERIEKARETLMKTHEDYHPLLDPQESDALHSAKNTAVTAESYLFRELKKQKHASQLSPDGRDQLLHFRQRLTDAQADLRDARTNRLVDYTLAPVRKA